MSTVDQVMNVLIEHTRIDGIHGDCSCGVVVPLGHRFTEHQAEELREAGLLRTDLEDDFGLSRVQVEMRMDQRTHVIIERAGVPIVNGFIEGPSDAVVHPDTATTERTCPGGC
jgi:hypothetical protein